MATSTATERPAEAGRGSGDGGPLPALAVGIGVVVACALVGAGTRDPDRAGGVRAADTVVTAGAVVVGLGALGAVVLVGVLTRRPPPAPGEPAGGIAPAWLLRPLVVQLLATLLLLSAFLLWSSTWPDDRGTSDDRAVAPSTTIARTEDRPPPDRSTGGTSWPVVAAITLGLAGLAMVVVATRVRGRAATVPPPDLDDEIATALADLDALDRDGDHRRVVLRTYARMERALGRTGVVRQPSEAPQEYLGRALEALGAGGAPAARLTTLFEHARFSAHPVDAAMRADAAVALRAVHARIEPAPAPAVRSGPSGGGPGTTRPDADAGPGSRPRGTAGPTNPPSAGAAG